MENSQYTTPGSLAMFASLVTELEQGHPALASHLRAHLARALIDRICAISWGFCGERNIAQQLVARLNILRQIQIARAAPPSERRVEAALLKSVAGTLTMSAAGA